MRRLNTTACLPVVALLALAACAASAPPVRLHSLMPVELASREAGRPAIIITLEPIRVPAQVDQPQWLVRLPDDSLAALEQERWVSPLSDELRQALLEELGAGYGAIEGRGAAGALALRVGVEVRRFDTIPGREARIEAIWTVAVGGATPALRCDALLREPAAAGMPALAAAHRRAVVRLADAIGDSLVSTRGPVPACPALDPR